MNLALTYCWREWRAQRGVLLAFTLMGLASLCLVFLLLPAHWWQDDGRGALALSWFVVVGGVGVVGFVAPTLVRGEFGQKGDQFVRRLPGALLPSFLGKLLFLVLATAALPIVCLAAGQCFLTAIDQHWAGLYGQHFGETWIVWPWPLPPLALAALLIPWVWAIGTWLPGGRMALGGTILFVLVLGVCVFAVLRQSPGLETGLAWQHWLWGVPPLGLVVAFVAWTRGRRGGGPWRSAQCGLVATAVGLVPPSAWCAVRVWDYHHPELQRLVDLHVHGCSPDGRFVLAAGAANPNFAKVPIRIDLQDGAAVQLGSILTWHTPELVKPYSTWPGGTRRFWRQDHLTSASGGVDAHAVFDLVRGTTTPIGWDEQASAAVLPSALAADVRAEALANTPLRAPGGRRAWFDGGDVCVEGAHGVVERTAWRGALPVSLRAWGHGFTAYVAGSEQRFDLVTRQQSEAKGVEYGYHVGGAFVFVKKGGPAHRWLRQDRDGAVVPVAELDGCGVLGLFDDEHLLCATGRHVRPRGLFLFALRAGERTELALPADLPAGPGAGLQAAWLYGPQQALLPRDPGGRIWLVAHDKTTERFVVLDAATRGMATVPEPRGRAHNRRLLGWPDAQSVLLAENATLVRVEAATGARTQLFPRQEPAR